MEKPNNYLYYPNNIFRPRLVNVCDKEYTLYKARFNDLYSLYYYLKSNPKTNNIVFPILQSEQNNDINSGIPYKEALENLIKKEEKDYYEFLSFTGLISTDKTISKHSFKSIKTITGGHLNIPLYSAGDPYCFDDIQRVKKNKFIKIYILVSYNASTTSSQVLNRAIIIANILKALENVGYSVDIDAFELSKLDDEIEYIGINLKNHGEKIIMSNLYKTLCHVEFFRRILFRVMESMDFNNYWGSGYGYKCNRIFTENLLNFTNKDIYFDQPKEMGINGINLLDDFESVIDYLNIKDIVNVEETKRILKMKILN